jgi:hypothetical protein
MSISYYLYCPDTKQAIHVAEESSGWFRGADEPAALGAFCVAHTGKTLLSSDADHFDDFTDYEVWTAEGAQAAYTALVGHSLPGYSPRPGQ